MSFLDLFEIKKDMLKQHVFWEATRVVVKIEA